MKILFIWLIGWGNIWFWFYEIFFLYMYVFFFFVPILGCRRLARVDIIDSLCMYIILHLHKLVHHNMASIFFFFPIWTVRNPVPRVTDTTILCTLATVGTNLRAINLADTRSSFLAFRATTSAWSWLVQVEGGSPRWSRKTQKTSLQFVRATFCACAP